MAKEDNMLLQFLLSTFSKQSFIRSIWPLANLVNSELVHDNEKTERDRNVIRHYCQIFHYRLSFESVICVRFDGPLLSFVAGTSSSRCQLKRNHIQPMALSILWPTPTASDFFHQSSGQLMETKTLIP